LKGNAVLEFRVSTPWGKGEVNAIGFFPAELSVFYTASIEPVVNIIEPETNAHFAKVNVSGKGEGHYSDRSMFTVS
jgi:hypothetical protein